MITESDQLLATLLGINAAFLVFVVVILARLGPVARAIRDDVRKVRIQQANIISMLLRAGFRPAKGGPDWRDDGDRTVVPSFTRFDWQSPEQRHGR